MILANEGRESLARGSIVCGAGDHWCALPPGADGFVLTASANDPGGWGLAWAATSLRSRPSGTVAFSGPIGVNGAAPPVQAASPGAAGGTDAAADAAVVNAIALVLKNLGFTA